jgi:hypothetical protein
LILADALREYACKHYDVPLYLTLRLGLSLRQEPKAWRPVGAELVSDRHASCRDLPQTDHARNVRESKAWTAPMRDALLANATYPLPPTDSSLATPAFVSIEDWQKLSSMSRSATYRALEDGNIVGVKVGRRVLIDAEASLRWLRSLPRARFGKGTAPNHHDTAP